MRKILLVTAAMLGMMSVSAQAQTSPSWNYVDVNYHTMSRDGLGSSLHGLSASGVASLNENFFMSVQMSGVNDSVGSNDIDAKALSIGVGVKASGFTVSQKPTDIFAQLHRGETETDINRKLFDSDFWVIDTGFRVMVRDNTEVGVMLTHYRLDDPKSFNGYNVFIENGTSAAIRLRHFISHEVALQAQAASSKDQDIFGVGVMYSF